MRDNDRPHINTVFAALRALTTDGGSVHRMDLYKAVLRWTEARGYVPPPLGSFNRPVAHAGYQSAGRGEGRRYIGLRLRA